MMHLSFRAVNTGTLDKVELPPQLPKMFQKICRIKNTQAKDDPQITAHRDATAVGARSQKHHSLFYKLWELNPEPSECAAVTANYTLSPQKHLSM